MLQFKEGIPRNWRAHAESAGLGKNVTRHELQDLLYPEDIYCSCGAMRPFRKTAPVRTETCGAKECANALKKQRTSKTSFEKYGVSHPTKSSEVKNKQAKTFEGKYGGHPTKLKSVQDTRAKTNLSRYGVLTPAIEPTRLKQSVLLRQQRELEKFNRSTWPDRVKQFSVELGITTSDQFNGFKHALKWKHTCGHEWVDRMKPIPKCPICSVSSEEAACFNFCTSLGEKPCQNDRELIKPYELDLFFPDKNLAIEMNGAYWHSDGKGLPLLDKLKLCANKNIRLLHVMDYEWNERPEIVKSHIRHALSLTSNKVNARNCQVAIIAPALSRQFLQETHLQGSAKAKFHFGLFMNAGLVAVMTIGKSRWAASEMEIIRWSTGLNLNVRGGFSKVLKFALEQIGNCKIISYCDKRYGTGKVYEAAGFSYAGDTKPGYFWLKGRKRLSRHQTQKHKLAALLGIEISGTETFHMEQAGWVKVLDAGHQRWVLENVEPM